MLKETKIALLLHCKTILTTHLERVLDLQRESQFLTEQNDKLDKKYKPKRIDWRDMPMHHHILNRHSTLAKESAIAIETVHNVRDMMKTIMESD